MHYTIMIIYCTHNIFAHPSGRKPDGRWSSGYTHIIFMTSNPLSRSRVCYSTGFVEACGGGGDDWTDARAVRILYTVIIIIVIIWRTRRHACRVGFGGWCGVKGEKDAYTTHYL